MVVEWSVISAIVSIIMSIGIVLVTYVKTWSKLDVTVQALSKTVEKLTSVVDKLMEEHTNFMVVTERMEFQVEEMSKRITRLEQMLDR